MTDLLIIIGYALLPAMGNAIGNLLAEMVKPPRWFIGAALHGSAGIAIALICFDLVPRIRETVPIYGFTGAFLLGAAFSLTMAWCVTLFRNERDDNASAAWMVYAAIGVDLFSDGLMTGAGSAVSFNLGILIAASQLVANIPGGFAAAANLRHREVTGKNRLLASLTMLGTVILSAVVGYVALQHAPLSVQNLVLAVIVGILLLATIEDMIPEGDAPRPPRKMSTAAFAIGFAGLALVSHWSSV